MNFVVRVVKKSREHFYSRKLVYMSFANGRRSEVTSDKHERFVTSVGLWNSLFRIKYGDFRDGVEEICEEYNSKCKFDATVKHTDAMELFNKFEGFIFTADEDNFIDPALVGLLRRHPFSEFVKWRNFRVGSDHKAHIWDETRLDVLPTGGYAVPADKGIERHIELLHCHGATGKQMDSFVLLRDEPLGLIMVHPSSHGVLSKTTTMNDIKNLIDKFLKNRVVDVMPRYLQFYNKIIKLYESL